jgi:hypothetical protein
MVRLSTRFGSAQGYLQAPIESTTTTYKLSTQAQELYRDWYNKLDKMRVTEERQGLELSIPR